VRCQVSPLRWWCLPIYTSTSGIRISRRIRAEEIAAFFGGDPDNFTFPRFDLDTAFVRIYDQGKPLHAEQLSEVCNQRGKEGDIAFTSGNPGATEREDTLAQLEYQRDVAQPFILNLYSELRGVLTEFGTKGRRKRARLIRCDS